MRPTRRPVPVLATMALAAVAAAACGSASAAGWSYAPAAKPAAPAVAVRTTSASASGATSSTAVSSTASAQRMGVASAKLPFRQDLTIVTGDMIGKTEYPAYIPSDLTLPAYSTVEIVITNFDDATALPKGSEQFAKVQGAIGGHESVQPIDLTAPNSPGPASTVTALDPAKVSHTFTVLGLGINVPVAAHARVSFLIQTGAPGTYTWRCMDPCGNGPIGWGSAMTARGYMEGTIQVV